MERVTENVYAATDIRGCNPGYVLTNEGAVIIDTPQLAHKGSRHARGDPEERAPFAT